MTLLTPTSTSSGFAGIGLALLQWSFIFKLDTLAKLFGISRWVKREKVVGWIDRNTGLFLAGTAATNLTIHGTSHPAVVPMTICMELTNMFVCYCIIKPMRAIKTASNFI